MHISSHIQTLNSHTKIWSGKQGQFVSVSLLFSVSPSPTLSPCSSLRPAPFFWCQLAMPPTKINILINALPHQKNQCIIKSFHWRKLLGICYFDISTSHPPAILEQVCEILFFFFFFSPQNSQRAFALILSLCYYEITSLLYFLCQLLKCREIHVYSRTIMHVRFVWTG